MEKLSRIDCADIVPGVMFSEPVFFDDGTNMFLPPRHGAKPYHVAVLKRWRVPYLLSHGHILQGTGTAGSAAATPAATGSTVSPQPPRPQSDEPAELEELSAFEDM